MLREHLIKAHPDRDGAFRWRGDGVSRIEGLSDAVFGFAITLLVVSVEAPRTFDALLVMLAGFPAFAGMFAILVMVWTAQYRFFRRYGLEDGRTIALNVVLLFFVVFFIYPLKFLFQTFVALWLGVVGRVADVPLLREQARKAFGSLRVDQWPMVMIVFALGYVAVFGLFALMHRHALRQADALDLDAGERLATRSEIAEHLTHVAVALASVAVTLGLPALFGWPKGLSAGVAGFLYMLEWPLGYLRHRGLQRARRALDAPGAASAVAPLGTPLGTTPAPRPT